MQILVTLWQGYVQFVACDVKLNVGCKVNRDKGLCCGHFSDAGFCLCWILFMTCSFDGQYSPIILLSVLKRQVPFEMTNYLITEILY